eukprot:8268488-Pyramimonas_sp.AAC.1
MLCLAMLLSLLILAAMPPKPMSDPGIETRATELATELVRDTKLYESMLAQRSIFIHGENGQFSVKPNLRAVEHVASYSEDGKLVPIKTIKIIVKAIDNHCMRKLSGPNVKANICYKSWVDAQARIGKRLVGLHKRNQKRPRKPRATKPKKRSSFVKIAAKVKLRRANMVT